MNRRQQITDERKSFILHEIAIIPEKFLLTLQECIPRDGQHFDYIIFKINWGQQKKNDKILSFFLIVTSNFEYDLREWTEKII